MTRLLTILAVLACVGAAPAQRPRTRPADLAAELRELRALVTALRAENAALKAELAQLKAPPAADQRIAEAMRDKRIVVGMTTDQAKRVAESLGDVSGEHKVDRTESKRGDRIIVEERWHFPNIGSNFPDWVYFEDGKVTRVSIPRLTE